MTGTLGPFEFNDDDADGFRVNQFGGQAGHRGRLQRRQAPRELPRVAAAPHHVARGHEGDDRAQAAGEADLLLGGPGDDALRGGPGGRCEPGR